MFETGHHSFTEPAEQHGANLLQESGQETTQVHTPHPSAPHVFPFDPKIASEPGHGGWGGVVASGFGPPDYYCSQNERERERALTV